MASPTKLGQCHRPLGRKHYQGEESCHNAPVCGSVLSESPSREHTDRRTLPTIHVHECQPSRRNIYRQPRQRVSPPSTSPGTGISRSPRSDANLRPWASEPGAITTFRNPISGLEYDELDPEDLGETSERRHTMEPRSPGPARPPNTLPGLRPRAQTMPASKNPILKDRSKDPALPSPGKSRKQFCFKKEVDVFYFDGQWDMIRSKSMDMPRDLVTLKGEEDGSKLASKHENQNPFHWLPSVIKKPIPISRHNGKKAIPGIASTAMKIQPYIDKHGQRRQKLYLKLEIDDRCVKDRTSVKALSSGTALVVKLYQNEAKDGGSAIVRERTERLELPAPVDPYLVKAQLHRSGDLEVYAPLLSCPSL